MHRVMLKIQLKTCSLRWRNLYLKVTVIIIQNLYGDSYCMALRTKRACPHKIALGYQMWWGRDIFLVCSLGPYGMSSAAGYPSSSHSSGRRPNPGGKFPVCPSRCRLSIKFWWSSGQFLNGDECFGTATGSWCILLTSWYCSSTEGERS